MQVALGRKGDYSVRAMLQVARGGGRQKARAIAHAMDIPDRYVPQILANLVSHGLLVATAGPEGGYELAREPEAISLLEVVEAAEGPIGLESCVLRGGSCEWRNVCPVHEVWSRAQSAMIQELSATTFADLAAADAEISIGGEPSQESPVHPKPTTRRGGQ
jgi:Rrf2 family protein